MRINDKQFIIGEKNDRIAENKKAESRREADTKKQASVPACGSSAGDTVALSPQARDIADIALQLKEASEVREELVNELKEKIQNGTYNVSGRDIADKIVDKAANNIF